MAVIFILYALISRSKLDWQYIMDLFALGDV
jgi:hypothetical protein